MYVFQNFKFVFIYNFLGKATNLRTLCYVFSWLL